MLPRDFFPLPQKCPASHCTSMVTDGHGIVHCLTQRLGGANHLNNNKKNPRKQKNKQHTLSFIFPFTSNINTLQLLHNSTLYTPVISVVVYLLRLQSGLRASSLMSENLWAKFSGGKWWFPVFPIQPWDLPKLTTEQWQGAQHSSAWGSPRVTCWHPLCHSSCTGTKDHVIKVRSMHLSLPWELDSNPFRKNWKQSQFHKPFALQL